MSGILNRAFLPSDKDFILSSWARSFMRSQDTGPIPIELYFETYRQVIEHVLTRPRVRIHVAVDPDMEAPFEIHGYIVAEPGPFRKGVRDVEKPAVHFLYVKETRRRKGLATSLMRAAQVDPRQPFFFTFRTPDARALVRACYWQGEYHPNIVKYTNHKETREN